MQIFQGLSLDSQMGRVNNTSAGKAFGVLVPVFMLQAVCRVPVDSVCDSIVFGMVSTLLLSINLHW